MNILKNIWNWLVFSSADPEKLSLTLKAGIPYLILVLGWTKFGGLVTADSATNLVDAFIQAVVLIGQLGLALTALFGAGRKIFLSVKAGLAK